MIHCIGNSHALMFSGSSVPPRKFPIWPRRHAYDRTSFFKTYSLGPIIAYNFYEHHHSKAMHVINTVRVSKENDYVMFCIGEVDCRWHIPKQAELQNRTLEDVTIECVQRYFRSLNEIHDLGYKVMAWMAQPSTTYGHSDNIESPVYQTCEIRNHISSVYNAELKKLCDASNIYFLDIFDRLLDPNTKLTNMSYYIDYCHLDPIKVVPMVMEKLLQDGLIKGE